MAAIASQIIEVASPVVQIIVVTGTASAVIRTVVFTTLKRFGAYDPVWDNKWPRFPWRFFWLKGWLRFKEWKEENFGSGTPSAGAAGAITQLALTYQPGQSLIGRVRLPMGIPYYSLIGEESERHTVYVASSRSGKSVQLETKLALLPEDAAVLMADPKGSATLNIFDQMERRGRPLCVLDPLGVTGRVTQQINWLKQIDFINERLGQDLTTMICNRLAALSFPQSGNEKPFFRDMGREGWARIMCFAKSAIPNATMLDVRKLATVGFIEHANGNAKLAMTMLWKAMQRCDAYEGYVSQYGDQMLAMDDRTRESVLATIRSRTAFWDHEQVKSVSRGNDVNLCDLKDPDKNLIISFPIPVGEMQTTLQSWIGGNISLALAVMEWIPGDLKTKTEFIIEEAQAIGEAALPGLGDKAALMAGMGVSLTVVVQDIPGFRKGFPQEYQSIMGNAQHVIFMACNDPETYQFIANNVFGRRTVKRKKWFIPFLWTVRSWEKDVITSDQVRRRLESSKGEAAVMRNGKRSMFVKIAHSYKTLPVWRINASRDHGETNARAWFRGIWQTDDIQRETLERANPDPDPQPMGLPQELRELRDNPFTREDAMALFGLSEPYSVNEVEARAACLNDNFPPEMIQHARAALGLAR